MSWMEKEETFRRFREGAWNEGDLGVVDELLGPGGGARRQAGAAGVL